MDGDEDDGGSQSLKLHLHAAPQKSLFKTELEPCQK